MWNKSTRTDIQAMFDSLVVFDEHSDVGGWSRTEGDWVKRGQPGRPKVHATEAERVAARKAKHKRYNDKNQSSGGVRLRVRQRTNDAEVVDCARQVG